MTLEPTINDIKRQIEETQGQAVHYWSDLADLTHATQVEQFGFCTCEEQEQFPYDDCPRPIMCGDCIRPITECGCLA